MSFKICHVNKENHKLLTGMMNEKLFSIRVLRVELAENRYQQVAKRSSGSIRKVPEEARLLPRA